MTEAEWLANPLRAVWPRELVSLRKLRLFHCACCRRVWQQLPDERSRQAVLAAEEYAESFIDDESLAVARDAAWDVVEEERQSEFPDSFWTEEGLPLPFSSAAYNVATVDGYSWGGVPADYPPSEIILERIGDRDSEAIAQCELLRDIFGNPFRPVTFPKSWRTENTVGLVAKMYDERDFAAMPILADALEEAGCDNADVLAHCREPGVHVRGCWVVDLVLGKA